MGGGMLSTSDGNRAMEFSLQMMARCFLAIQEALKCSTYYLNLPQTLKSITCCKIKTDKVFIPRVFHLKKEKNIFSLKNQSLIQIITDYKVFLRYVERRNSHAHIKKGTFSFTENPLFFNLPPSPNLTQEVKRNKNGNLSLEQSSQCMA